MIRNSEGVTNYLILTILVIKNFSFDRKCLMICQQCSITKRLQESIRQRSDIRNSQEK